MTAWIKALKALLHEQRQQMGHLIFLLAASGQLASEDVLNLVKWLSKATGSTDSLSVYILVSVFQALSPVSDEEDEEDVPAVFKDPQLFVNLSSTLNPTWSNADLRSAMLLQYSLFHLEIRSRDEHVRGEVSVIEDEVGASLKKAIHAGAFQALSRIILRSRDPRFSSERPEFSLAADDSISSGRAVHLDVSDEQCLVPRDFRGYLLDAVDSLTIALIQRLSRTLRDVRKHEEDLVHMQRNPRSIPSTSASISADPIAQQNTESLFRLIAIVYDEKGLDAGLCYWTDDDGGRLFPFLRWAAESREPSTIVGVLDMLVSLARGPSCAAFAYNFLSAGGGHFAAGEDNFSSPSSCSWSTLFMALHHYETRLPPSQLSAQAGAPPLQHSLAGAAPGQSTQAPPRFVLQPAEVSMLGAFLRLLRNVARFSPVARFALHENRDFRALTTLFNMASHSIPLELKAMLFDSLAAFAAPGGGQVAVDLAHQMWAMLEKMEIIPVKSVASTNVLSGRMGRPTGGAVAELEMVEVPGKTYPATLALIQLLNSLIHTPQKSLTLRAGYEAESKTIPTTLGAGYRLPGLKPYVDFVIDKVFVNLFSREYIYPDEQWQLMEASLCFIEKSLATFDVGALNGLNVISSDRTKLATTLSSLGTHPGFFTLKTILGNATVRDNVLYAVKAGFTESYNHLNSSFSRNKAVLRSFRTTQRVLQIQGAFGEIMVPLLNEFGELPSVGFLGFPVSSLVPLDAFILQSPSVIPNIALYASTPDPQVSYFVTKVLCSLSDHPNFNWGHAVDPIVAAIESSQESARIMSGFVSWLDTEAPDDRDAQVESGVVMGDSNSIGEPEAADVRCAVMELLLHNTRSSSSPANLAHFLLGIRQGARSDVIVNDIHPAGKTCLHSVLALLSRGVVTADRQTSPPPIASSHPALAEQCYRLAYQLCTHTFSSSAIIRFLRSRERFFTIQQRLLPTAVVTDETCGGRITYQDGVSFVTSASAVASSARIQCSILQLLAIEMRVLHESRQRVRLDEMVDGLFGLVASTEADGSAPGQNLTRMLQMLDGYSFSWQETTPLANASLQLLSDIDWESALRVDEHGCQIYDSRHLVVRLRDARISLQRSGAMSVSGAEQRLRTETAFVLETAVRENNVRQLAFVKSLGLQAWSALLDVALSEAFDSIRPQKSEAIIHDLLLALPRHIALSNAATATTLSGTYLLLSTRLHDSIVQQLYHSSLAAMGSGQPSERLHTHMKNAWECVLQQGTSERTRGNLYAAIVRHLQIVQEYDSVSVQQRQVEGFNDGSQSKTSSRTAIFVGAVKIINVIADRIIPIICRDAVDGSEVWKTVSYTLLSALVEFTSDERSQRVLNALVRDGYLQTIVASIRDSSADLSKVIQSDHGECHDRSIKPARNSAHLTGSLNALYVYEAKMTLLLRLSSYRTGAEKLIESRVLPILSSFDVFASNPIAANEVTDGKLAKH